MTRAEAIAAGLATYTRDTPCKHGHEPIFIVSQWACRECRRIRDRANYERKMPASTKPVRQRKDKTKPMPEHVKATFQKISRAKGSEKGGAVADRRSAEERAAAMELVKLAPVPDFLALCEARMMQGRVG